jgi:carbonic anhydrase
MEAHFVHGDADGNLAMLAVWYQKGRENEELKKAWDHMPLHPGEKYALPNSLDALALLPDQPGYYRFNGSLTTPPCSEGVIWLVMKYYNTVSKEQIEKFTQAMHGPNNRPVQPVKARMIVK